MKRCRAFDEAQIACRETSEGAADRIRLKKCTHHTPPKPSLKASPGKMVTASPGYAAQSRVPRHAPPEPVSKCPYLLDFAAAEQLPSERPLIRYLGIEQPVQMDDEIPHMRVVDGALRG